MSESGGPGGPELPDEQDTDEPGVGRDEGRVTAEEDDGSESLEHGGGGAG